MLELNTIFTTFNCIVFNLFVYSLLINFFKPNLQRKLKSEALNLARELSSNKPSEIWYNKLHRTFSSELESFFFKFLWDFIRWYICTLFWKRFYTFYTTFVRVMARSPFYTPSFSVYTICFEVIIFETRFLLKFQCVTSTVIFLVNDISIDIMPPNIQPLFDFYFWCPY